MWPLQLQSSRLQTAPAHRMEEALRRRGSLCSQLQTQHPHTARSVLLRRQPGNYKSQILFPVTEKMWFRSTDTAYPPPTTLAFVHPANTSCVRTRCLAVDRTGQAYTQPRCGPQATHRETGRRMCLGTLTATVSGLGELRGHTKHRRRTTTGPRGGDAGLGYWREEQRWGHAGGGGGCRCREAMFREAGT